jgi:hypothetical protein
MTWIPLLLADKSPALRYLVLKNLLNKDESDEEVQELQQLRMEDPIIKDILDIQQPNGSWNSSDRLGLNLQDSLRNTAQALIRLGF